MNGTVLAVGYHAPEGARHWVIARGLEARGWRVDDRPTAAAGLGKLTDVRRILRERLKDASAVLVTYPGQYLLPWVWLLTRFSGKPLVLDAFISVYDTKVRDRRIVSTWSPRGWGLWLLDWLSCHLSDAVLIDTPEHAAYFMQTFGVPAAKMIVVPIGCRTDLFTPGEERACERAFTVVFHGTFIPLQGIETILDAARALKKQGDDTHVLLIGKGQTYDAMHALADEWALDNVTFAGTRTATEVVGELRQADCALGIFGTTDKAARVIPHKAYEILACARPLITGDSPSARAVFHDGQDALLTPLGDGKALAAAILRLKADPGLRSRLAAAGRRLFQEHYTPPSAVAALDAWLRR